MDGSNINADSALERSQAEARAFVNRIERLNQEIKDKQADVKEVYSEAKGQGYLTTPLRKFVAMRGRDRDDMAVEDEEIQRLKDAFGMS